MGIPCCLFWKNWRLSGQRLLDSIRFNSRWVSHLLKGSKSYRKVLLNSRVAKIANRWRVILIRAMNATSVCACIAKRISRLHIGIVSNAEAYFVLVIKTNVSNALLFNAWNAHQSYKWAGFVSLAFTLPQWTMNSSHIKTSCQVATYPRLRKILPPIIFPRQGCTQSPD